MRYVFFLVFFFVGVVFSSVCSGGLYAQSALLPSISDTIHPRDWLVAGPFPSGARESATDPLYAHGGYGSIIPEAGMEHHSLFHPSGVLSWQPDTLGDDHILRITHEVMEPSWDFWRSYKGRTFTRVRNYGWTTFHVPQASRALVAARGVGSFRLNGKRYSGDFYNNKYLNIPVVLEEGENSLLLSLSGSPSSSAYVAIMPISNDLQVITDDITAPDLYAGQPLEQALMGIPVVNHTNKWQRQVQLSIYSNLPGQEPRLLSSKTLPPIGPMAWQHSAHSPDLSGLSWSAIMEKDSLPLMVVVENEDQSYTFYTHLDIKAKDSPYNITFLDSDRSVQFYSAFPPAEPSSSTVFPAIFMLHGAGVDASGSNGFTQKDRWWVIAPTNRRRFGFDWEKQGKVNALNTLSHAIDHLSLDSDRIYLTGHSMGGHGSWVAAVSHPHLFAALGPSAGWTSFDIYTPFVSRMDHLLGSPDNLQLLYAGLQPTRTLSLVENLNNMPVFILHGGNDKSVPVDHPRLFYQRLSQLNYEVTYLEEPGKGHWWRFDHTEGADCVNHEKLMAFFKGKKRTRAPKEVRFRTAGLAESHRAYWVSIQQRENFFQDSKVHAQVIEGNEKDTLQVKTINVRKLALDLEKAPVNPQNTVLIINQQLYTPHEKAPLVEVNISHGRVIAEPIIASSSFPEKTPGRCGPIKQVFYEPFAIVYATGAGSNWEEQTYAQARQLAQDWYYRGNGRTIIIADTLVCEAIESQYNLILLGSAQSNSYMGKIHSQLPIRVYSDSTVIGHTSREKRSFFRRLVGDKYAVTGHQEVLPGDLSVKYVYPNPLNPHRLVQINGGATPESQARSTEVAMISSADALPDYLIFDHNIRKKGLAALIKGGFFDNQWNYHPRHAFCQPWQW